MTLSGKLWPKTTSAFVLGADTNVLVRFLTRDDADEAPQALALISNTANQPIRVCLIALVELVWVLTKVKKQSWPEVFRICRELMANSRFEIERPELAEKAISSAEAAGCDLADSLIALLNAEAGCETTATFDHRAQRLDDMAAVAERI
jgi:predicted nucleic-acid-binding protein